MDGEERDSQLLLKACPNTQSQHSSPAEEGGLFYALPHMQPHAVKFNVTHWVQCSHFHPHLQVEAGCEQVLDLPQEGHHLVHLGSSPAAWGEGGKGGDNGPCGGTSEKEREGGRRERRREDAESGSGHLPIEHLQHALVLPAWTHSAPLPFPPCLQLLHTHGSAGISPASLAA